MAMLSGDFLSLAAIVIGGGRGEAGHTGYGTGAGLSILQCRIPSFHRIVLALVG